MKRKRMTSLLCLLSLLVPSTLLARDISPIVSTDWLEKNLQNPRLKIIDIRKVEEYKEGHIQGAFKSEEEIAEITSGVLGKDKGKEIISYCDTGRLASVGWFLLSEILGYKNVKLYDGSMEEWGKDPKTPVVKYRWQ